MIPRPVQLIYTAVWILVGQLRRIQIGIVLGFPAATRGILCLPANQISSAAVVRVSVALQYRSSRYDDLAQRFW